MCELCFEFHCMIVAILQIRGYFPQATPLLYANFLFKHETGELMTLTHSLAETKVQILYLFYD